MKRRILSALIALILTFSFAGCREEKTEDFETLRADAIALVNQNCDTPLKLATPSGEIEQTEDFSYEPGFGCYGLSNDGVRYTVSGYPDVLDAYHLTDIQLSSDKYRLFGFTVGDSFDEAVRHFEAFGFTENKELREEHTGRNDSGPVTYRSATMELNGVLIRLSSGNDVIYEIKLQLVTTNIQNAVF